MSKLFIDDKALEVLKKEMIKENAYAVRIFAGAGCLGRFEIASVKKALAGDVVFTKYGIKIFVEKHLSENTSAIEIKFDEQKGLLIYLQE